MTVRDASRFAARWRRWRGRERRTAPPPERGPVLGPAEDGRLIRWAPPSLERGSHVAAFAATGVGKTILIGRVLAEECASATDGLALCLLDPKGDLAAAVIEALAERAPERLRDVRILDPFDPAGGFPFNLCRMPASSTPVDIRALQLAGLVAVVSTSTGAQAHLGAGARQIDTLLHLLLASLTTGHPRANVLWALDALTQKDGMKTLQSLTASERAREFLKSAKLSDELRVSTASRLRAAFGATEHLERLIAAPGCIDWNDLLAPGRIAIIDVGRPTGGLLGLQRFYANLIVRMAIDHLLERPSPWKGHPVRLVVDEVQVVAPVLADVAEVLLTTGRSRALSLVAISQGTTLIREASDSLLRVLMTNSARLIGRLGAPDAELLSRELAPRRGVDETLSSVRSGFVSLVTNLPDRHFLRLAPGEMTRFASAPVDLDGWTRAAGAQANAIAEARRALCLGSSEPRVLLSAAKAKPGKRREAVAERPVECDETQEGPEPEPTEPRDGRPMPRSRWG